jgi:hypothetical protein
MCRRRFGSIALRLNPGCPALILSRSRVGFRIERKVYPAAILATSQCRRVSEFQPVAKDSPTCQPVLDATRRIAPARVTNAGHVAAFCQITVRAASCASRHRASRRRAVTRRRSRGDFGSPLRMPEQTWAKAAASWPGMDRDDGRASADLSPTPGARRYGLAGRRRIVIGALETEPPWAVRIAEGSGAVVVSVDWRDVSNDDVPLEAFTSCSTHYLGSAAVQPPVMSSIAGTGRRESPHRSDGRLLHGRRRGLYRLSGDLRRCGSVGLVCLFPASRP